MRSRSTKPKMRSMRRGARQVMLQLTARRYRTRYLRRLTVPVMLALVLPAVGAYLYITAGANIVIPYSCMNYA